MQDEIVDEAVYVDVLRIAIDRIVPGDGRPIVQHVFHVAQPTFDLGPLRGVDCIAVRNFKVDDRVVLPGNVIAFAQRIGRRLEDSIGSGGMKKLRRADSANRNRIHAVNAQQPAALIAAGREAFEIETAVGPFDLLGKDIDADKVVHRDVAAVFVHKRLDVSHVGRPKAELPADLEQKCIVHQREVEIVQYRIRIRGVQNPVRLKGQSQRADVFVNVRAVAPTVERVAGLIPRRRAVAAPANADAGL